MPDSDSSSNCAATSASGVNPYRLPKAAGALLWRGHKEYDGNPTACPGAMLGDYKECWR